MYFDREGQPINATEWAEIWRTPGARQIGLTTIGEWNVSTVWLGIDHGMLLHGRNQPVIFETMVFYTGTLDEEQMHPELRGLDQACIRYCTAAEAEAGHDRTCVDLRVLLANIEMAAEVQAEAIARSVLNQPKG